MKDIMRMCSGVFYDPKVQTQVLDVLQSKQVDIYRKLLGVATDQEWYSIPFILKLDGCITEEDGDHIKHEDLELDAMLNIAKRYTHNGCNVDIELSAGSAVGATCIPDMAFENLTGISFGRSSEHYEFIINLTHNADGLLKQAVIAEKVANAILDGWTPVTEGFCIETEFTVIGSIVVNVKRAEETPPAAVGLPDKFSVEVRCVNDDSSVMMGKSWFRRDEVA